MAAEPFYAQLTALPLPEQARFAFFCARDAWTEIEGHRKLLPDWLTAEQEQTIYSLHRGLLEVYAPTAVAPVPGGQAFDQLTPPVVWLAEALTRPPTPVDPVTWALRQATAAAARALVNAAHARLAALDGNEGSCVLRVMDVLEKHRAVRRLLGRAVILARQAALLAEVRAGVPKNGGGSQ